MMMFLLRENTLEISFSARRFSYSVVLPRNFTTANIRVFGMNPLCYISLWEFILRMYLISMQDNKVVIFVLS